jgi:hypothetical protein
MLEHLIEHLLGVASLFARYRSGRPACPLKEGRLLELALNTEDHRQIRQRAGPHVERRNGRKGIMRFGIIESEHALKS